VGCFEGGANGPGLDARRTGAIIGAERTRGGSVIPYQTKYPVGSSVKIARVERLRAFMRPEWKYHHPVLNEQLVSAGKTDKVRWGFIMAAMFFTDL
jgi:hypothetical protein